jgi:hypothetical protein
MKKAAVALVVLVGAAGGFLAGSAWKNRAVTACEAQVTRLERERDEAQSARGSQLASALAIAERGFAEARHTAPPRAPAASTDAHKSGVSISFDDAPDGGSAEHHGDENPALVLMKLKDKGSDALAEMQRAVRLSSDQRATLDRATQAMNLAIGDAIEHFARRNTDEVKPRELIPIAIDALTAMKKADDDFRASLDDGQRRALDENGFEVLSQIDPLVLLRLMPAPNQSPR